LALTEATTTTVNQTASFNLSRTDPSENWLDVRNRTNLSFFELYSNTHAPYSPNALVSVFQANAVHDFYISQRTYAFAGASFEHTSPQGLDLMQAYGGGLGEVLIKNDTTIFEVRVGLGYMHQSFIDPLLNKNILGSRFGEDFSKTFKNGVTIVEQAGIRPAWTYSRAFFAGGNATVTVPVYRRLGVSLGLVETFLNNPPPYFKKNNFQATFGLHYSLK
jgi:putative salt-induced outer membrane protein YdiY